MADNISINNDKIMEKDTSKKLVESINTLSSELAKIIENEKEWKNVSVDFFAFLKSEKEQKQDFTKELQIQINSLNNEKNEIITNTSKEITDLKVQISYEQNINKNLQIEKQELIRKVQDCDIINENKEKLETELLRVKNKLAEVENTLEEKKIIERELNERKKAFDVLSSDYNKLELINTKLEQQINEIKGELNYYDINEFTSLKKAYDLFINFSKRTRENIQSIFQTDSFLGFISNALQWDRIAAIWEQAKRKIIKSDMEDFNELRSLFLILFKIYTSGYTTPLYTLLIPDIGCRYNSENMIIVNDKSDGNVKEVLLEGYMYIETNKVHDALVLVD